MGVEVNISKQLISSHQWEPSMFGSWNTHRLRSLLGIHGQICTPEQRKLPLAFERRLVSRRQYVDFSPDLHPQWLHQEPSHCTDKSHQGLSARLWGVSCPILHAEICLITTSFIFFFKGSVFSILASQRENEHIKGYFKSPGKKRLLTQQFSIYLSIEPHLSVYKHSLTSHLQNILCGKILAQMICGLQGFHDALPRRNRQGRELFMVPPCVGLSLLLVTIILTCLTHPSPTSEGSS